MSLKGEFKTMSSSKPVPQVIPQTPPFKEIEFTQPDKLCGGCGKVIPANGVFDGQWYRIPRLICETCAINAAPPSPPRPRAKRGQVGEEQMRIEAPVIFVK